MAVYTFHVPQDAAPGDPKALERAVLVRDGFSWGALVFQPFWCLWNRLWLMAFGWVAMTMAVSAIIATLGISDAAGRAANLLLACLFAFEANSLRRLALEWRGLAMHGVVVAPNAQEAERRAFAIWLKADQPSASVAEETLVSEEAASAPAPFPHFIHKPDMRDTGIIGLFPPAEDMR